MIDEGVSATIALTVSRADTAVALGSGDVTVLGTPRIVALCEEAAVAALAGLLPEGATSVGTNITIDHLAATRVGGAVTANAIVSAVDGREIAFALEVTEGDTVVARGAHTRVVIDRKRFEEAVVN